MRENMRQVTVCLCDVTMKWLLITDRHERWRSLIANNSSLYSASQAVHTEFVCISWFWYRFLYPAFWCPSLPPLKQPWRIGVHFQVYWYRTHQKPKGAQESVTWVSPYLYAPSASIVQSLLPSKSCLIYMAKYEICTTDPWKCASGFLEDYYLNWTHILQGFFIGPLGNSFDCFSTG